MNSLFSRTLLSGVLCLAGVSLTLAQEKQPLDHDVYDIWNRVTEQALSNDGDWVLWSSGPVEGNATLDIRSITANPSYTIARGTNAAFSADSRFAAFHIKPPQEAIRAAKLEKKKADEQPKDSLGILNLNTGDLALVARVKSFKIPEEGSGWIAYLLEKPLPDTTQTEEPEVTEEPEAEEGEEETEKKKDKKPGTPLVLRSLTSGDETRIADVTDYHFTKDGRFLVYSVSSEDGAADGVFAIDVASGTTTALMTGEGHYVQLALNEGSSHVAFLSDRDDYAADQPSFTLYHGQLGSDGAAALVTEGTTGVPADWWVSEHGTLSFSENGTRIFLGTAPRPAPEPEEDDVLEEEQVKVDIWNWKDPLLQPMQLVQKSREEKRTYRAVVHLADNNRVVQLASEALPNISLGQDGDADVALGYTNMPYRQAISWDWPRYYDAYHIDITTGEAVQVLERVQSVPQLSPEATYLTWWDRDAVAWFAMPTAGGEPINLTGNIPHPVYNELHDWPYKPNPYGNAGWTEDDALFLVYDKHDIWATDPTGRQAPRSITEETGRAEDLRFRYIRLDREADAIAPNEPILLSAFGIYSKQDGFYHDRVRGTRTPEPLVLEDRNFSTPRKAKDADRLLFTRSSFEEFSNLWVSSLDVVDMERISDVNPQQKDYLWGTAELVEWTSLDGKPLQGRLYKPENFDPSTQYPTMVYFYEKSSDGLHSHIIPQVHGSIINIPFYVSRGYVVFVPDIPYKIGYPGESAMNAVMPGVTHLISQGFIDADNIGVQGHSWGGYQIAYMVTRTNLFKAAEAGAPVSNMISAYGGIRWASGMSRMFQYERTQSRLGGSLWETPMRYFENSPIFMADKIETPLLMMHNDDDGAVPWYQGIELFVAMRRLGKPAWLINYNGEPHNLRQDHNRRDWAKRMQQFFDHYLQGAPAPMWLSEGIPAIQKGKTLGFEIPGVEIVSPEK